MHYYKHAWQHACYQANHCDSHYLGGRYDHPVKGQGIYAYVTLMQDTEYSPELKKELVKTVRGHIGAFAAPDVIHWAPGGTRCLTKNYMYPNPQPLLMPVAVHLSCAEPALLVNAALVFGSFCP